MVGEFLSVCHLAGHGMIRSSGGNAETVHVFADSILRAFRKILDDGGLIAVQPNCTGRHAGWRYCHLDVWLCLPIRVGGILHVDGIRLLRIETAKDKIECEQLLPVSSADLISHQFLPERDIGPFRRSPFVVIIDGRICFQCLLICGEPAPF